MTLRMVVINMAGNSKFDEKDEEDDEDEENFFKLLNLTKLNID